MWLWVVHQVVLGERARSQRMVFPEDCSPEVWVYVYVWSFVDSLGEYFSESCIRHDGICRDEGPHGLDP